MQRIKQRCIFDCEICLRTKHTLPPTIPVPPAGLGVTNQKGQVSLGFNFDHFDLTGQLIKTNSGQCPKSSIKDSCLLDKSYIRLHQSVQNSKKDKNSWLTMAERAPSSADFYTTGDEQLQQFQPSVIIRKTEGNYTKITGLRT